MGLPLPKNIFLALVGLFGLVHYSQAQIVIAQVTGGLVQGVVEEGVASFKGIPFAAPPLGELRWRGPQPVKPWQGAKKADTFAPGGMQDVVLSKMQGGSDNLSEDCLYLNVWTPAKQASEKLPVMVWIHGGGFSSGMTSIPLYDGSRLAQKGVVFVSIAYRMGPLGFLAHPDLTKESGKGSGCYGLQDQVAGLRWVKENIARFGGDPSRVTIFGESAGAISVSMLTAVPAAKGLFSGAISESGGSFTPPKTANEASTNVFTLKAAEEMGKNYLAKLGAMDIKTARTLSAAAIQKDGGAMGYFWPAVDGETLLGDQYELYKAGKFNDTPILIGTNSDEGALFVPAGITPAGFEGMIQGLYGPAAQGLLKVYPHSTDAQAHKAAKDIFRDGTFGWSTTAWATLHSQKSRNKVFVYYFDHHAPEAVDGASHADEIAYVFRNLEHRGFGRPVGAPTADDLKVSDLMSSYWVNFAKTGDPNGAGLPVWPAFDEKAKNTLMIRPQPTVIPVPNQEKLAAFDAYFAGLRERNKAASGK